VLGQSLQDGLQLHDLPLQRVLLGLCARLLLAELRGQLRALLLQLVDLLLQGSVLLVNLVFDG
jgi:hypothetical protein